MEQTQAFLIKHSTFVSSIKRWRNFHRKDFHWNYIVTCVLYNIKLCFYNQFWTWISIRSTPFNWTADDPIFALLHLALIFSTYFLQLIVLMLCKISLSDRNNFINDEHVFLRIFGHKFTSSLLWHLGHTRYMYTILSK